MSLWDAWEAEAVMFSSARSWRASSCDPRPMYGPMFDADQQDLVAVPVVDALEGRHLGAAWQKFGTTGVPRPSRSIKSSSSAPSSSAPW